MSAAGWLMVAAFAAEFLLFTFGRNVAGPWSSPVLLYAAAWAFVLAGLRAFWGRPLPALAPLRPRQWAWALLPAATWALFGPRVGRLLSQAPIDAAVSDVIPTIQVLASRWLAGQPVYVLIPDFGYELEPTYLPLMWLPFVPAQLLHLDYRWLAWGGFGAVVAAGWLLAVRRHLPWPAMLALLAVPALALQALLQTDPNTLTRSVELLMVAYYLLLALSVWRGAWWAQAATLTLCLLSRFSLVFWVPLWLALLAQQAGRRTAWQVAGAVAGLVLALYVVPFLCHDWSVFWRAQDYYTGAAVAEWQHLGPHGLPEHLYRGVGLAAFFHRFAPGSIPERVQLLRLVHAGACVAVAAAAAVYWWRWRPALDYRAYALLALKAYLATFYAFVQVPYTYLTWVGVLMAWPLLLMLPGRAAEAAPGPAALR